MMVRGKSYQFIHWHWYHLVRVNAHWTKWVQSYKIVVLLIDTGFYNYDMHIIKSMLFANFEPTICTYIFIIKASVTTFSQFNLDLVQEKFWALTISRKTAALHSFNFKFLIIQQFSKTATMVCRHSRKMFIQVTQAFPPLFWIWNCLKFRKSK